jgi:hypothetical protein
MILGGPRQTRKIHVEENWQEVQSNPEDEAMTDVFARCFKNITAQVCTQYMITKFMLLMLAYVAHDYSCSHFLIFH